MPAGEVHDGWDFDCDWDGSLISPDGAVPEQASEAATGDSSAVPGAQQPAAADTAAGAVPDQADTDQHWVGLGPQPGPCIAPPPSAPLVRGNAGQHTAAAAGSDSKAADGTVCTGVTCITADSTWEEVQRLLGDGGRATIHSRGFAQNPFGPTLVRGYRGVAFEALKDGRLASLTLFQA